MKRRNIDVLKTIELTSSGYRVIRLFEHEITKLSIFDFQDIIYKEVKR